MHTIRARLGFKVALGALGRSGHPFWLLQQQIAVRGMLAAKYFLTARLLGPEQIGIVGVALLTLAIVESLSDIGIAPAVVQRKSEITAREAGSIWLLQLSRGVIVAVVIAVIAWPVSHALNVEKAVPLVLLAALVPLLRNSVNPGIHLQVRARNFRALLVYEGAPAALDFSVTLLCISSGVGPASLIIGTLAAEGLKLTLTWLWFRVPLLLSRGVRHISDLASYGKWVWAGGVVATLINNADKVLVARLVGPAEFGLYQVAVRLAQLLISDLAVFLSRYLFPTFAAHFRASEYGASRYFWRMFGLSSLVLGVITVCLVGLAPVVVRVFLGREWIGVGSIVQVLSLSMFSGGLISIVVAYLRAVGRPKVIFHASCLQLFVLLFLAPVVTMRWGAQGAAAIAGISVTTALLYLLSALRK